MKEASYGEYDKLALKWLKVKATFIHFIGYNYFTALSNLLPPVPIFRFTI